MKNYSEQAKAVHGFIGKLIEDNSEVGKSFMLMRQSALKSEALSSKEKELMALAISIAIRCEGCIACHVDGSLKQGATEEEIMETIEVAIVMGGGPSITYGEKAYQAMKEMALVPA